MDAQAMLQSGDIAGARAAVAAELRRAPQDVRLRQFFWQLLAVAGEWDKAEQQLRTLATTEPKAMMLGSVYNQALAAMRARAKVMSGEVRATSLIGSEPWVDGLLDALQASATGAADAAERSQAALDAAPATPGAIDEQPFDWIADADQRFGPMLEVIIGDAYGFVPFAGLKRVKVSAPDDLRDLVWLPVELETRSGQTSMAFTPATYAGTAATGDGALMLGRRTDWIARDGIDAGLGLRVLATNEDDFAIASVRDIRLA